MTRARTTPIDTEPTRCYPSRPKPRCESCTRYRAGYALHPLDRPHVVLIDGSIVERGHACPMYSHAEPAQTAWPILAAA